MVVSVLSVLVVSFTTVWVRTFGPMVSTFVFSSVVTVVVLVSSFLQAVNASNIPASIISFFIIIVFIAKLRLCLSGNYKIILNLGFNLKATGKSTYNKKLNTSFLAKFFLFLTLAKAMTEEQVILVNENDEPIGLMPKMEAHEKAMLHRAFSVFILNSKNEIMLQQRAAHKYHSPLLWTNTTCSHQREGETNIQAGTRRLMEEMGITAELKELFHFIYKAPFDNGLTEHELDHVMIGYYNDEPNINPDEAESWKWMGIEAVKDDMQLHPELYTVWFRIIFDEFYHYLEDHKL